ncbi:MAG: hypothetical protein GYA39_03950 [Methanothrix sp.]|nr:hypothetical protein [Methanothrix sp.]
MHTSPRDQIGEREGRPACILHQAERLEAMLSDERTTNALLKKALSLKVAIIKLGKRNDALAALIALLIVVTATASDDLSGCWKIRYEVENGDADDLTQGSVASLTEKDSTLQGRVTLGPRDDGFLIGCCESDSVKAAITFRHSPNIFILLIGSIADGELQGSFTASSSEGGFLQGKFRAIHLTTGVGEFINAEAVADPISFTPLDVDLRPKPTEFLDPEANWSAQQESGVKETFVISYRKNTILMLRNEPFIWQWWL